MKTSPRAASFASPLRTSMIPTLIPCLSNLRWARTVQWFDGWFGLWSVPRPMNMSSSGRATMPLMHPMMSVDPSEGARRAQCPPGLHFSASAQRRTHVLQTRDLALMRISKLQIRWRGGGRRAEIFIGARGFRGETPRSIVCLCVCAVVV